MRTSPIIKKIIHGSAWAFVGRVVLAFSGLLISSIIARIVTVEEVGAYFVTMSIVTIASMIAQLGLTQTAVRLVAGLLANENAPKAKQSIIMMLRILGVSTCMVSLILYFYVGDWLSITLFKSSLISLIIGWAALLVIIGSFQQVISEIFRGFHDIKLATLFGGLLSSIITMLLFALLWFTQDHGDLEQIMILSVGAGLVSTLIGSVMLRGKLVKISSSNNSLKLSNILSISWPLWITNITLFVLSQADLWIVGTFMEASDVAIYGAATRVVTLVGLPLFITNAVIQPLIAEMHSQGKMKVLEKLLGTVTMVSSFLSLIILISLFFLGEYLLTVIFGGYYKLGNTVLLILGFGQLVNVFTGPSGYLLMLTGHQISMMNISLVCGFVTVLLGCLLVLKYGEVGVAIAATTGMIFQNLLMLFFVKKKVGIWSHARSIKNMKCSF